MNICPISLIGLASFIVSSALPASAGSGGELDREVVSFDGRVLITRFTDQDAATRYGNMVYVRCAPRA